MPATGGAFVTWLGSSGVATAAATAATTAVVGAVANKAMTKKPVTPTTAVIPTPDKPQDQSVLMKRNATAAAGALSGNASTLLTGSGGVNPATLNLGSTSLLGQ
jgi:hypothetical protein